MAGFVKQGYKSLLIGLIVLLLGTAASCGGRLHKAPAKGAVPLEHKAYTLQVALAELDALEKPEGVDTALWNELKGALKKALETEGRGFTPRRSVRTPDGGPQVAALQQNPEPGWSARRTLKFVSSPPLGPANKINDLKATRETNGDFTLTWHYRNLGDYDQNGVVGVSDITPLAMHYNETYNKETEPDCIQAVIDGSGNGKVGVEDVTQLAQYFGNECVLYAMQGGDQQQGPFTQATTVQPPAEGRGDARLAFTFGLSSQPPYTYWRVVPLDGNNNPGEASNVVALNVEAPVRVLGVTPLSGLAGADVTFTAFVAGTGPFTYEWDFGGGATPNISSAAQPIVTLNNDAVDTQYAAHVKVTGATGSVTHHFTLTVTTMPGEPPVINSVGPFSGLSGEQINFSAGVSGDEPMTYSWEFDGGASPPVSADADPTAILSRGGTLPAPAKDYPCRLTVSNPSGSASADFTLTVSAQWHELDFSQLPPNDGYWSFALAPDGTPTIAVSKLMSYDGSIPDTVFYYRWLNGGWAGEIADNNIRGSRLVLAYDPQGHPGILVGGGWLNGREGNKYLHYDGSAWTREDFDDTTIANSLDLAYYPDGTPIAVYTTSELVGADLILATRSSQGWELEPLITEGGNVTGSTFILGEDGRLHIGYGWSTTEEFGTKYTTKVDGTWIYEWITHDSWGSIVLDSQGRPATAFWLDYTGWFYTTRTETGWQSELIDIPSSYAGVTGILTIDGADVPILLRHRYLDSDLLLSYRTSTEWATEPFGPAAGTVPNLWGVFLTPNGDTSVLYSYTVGDSSHFVMDTYW